MEVKELNKPKDVWCQKCAVGKGCKIYTTRPKGCADFQCLWLSSGWPADMRPDRTKVMFIATNDQHIVSAVVHPKYLDAWKVGRVARFIERLRTKLHVVIVRGTERTFLGGDAPVAPRIAEELNKLHGRPG